MKKADLKKLALLGITGGVMLSAQVNANTQADQSDIASSSGVLLAQNGCGGGCGSKRNMKNMHQQQSGMRQSNMNKQNGMMHQNNTMKNSKMMSEDEFWNQLNTEGRRLFNSMGSKEREFARKLASQSCAGQNDCKGLNSCKTDSNSCAGEGSCAGHSPGPFKDKNQAVKVAHQHMQEQRDKMHNNSQTNYRYNNRDQYNRGRSQ